jgi:pimeloyl-ACP methyl ester carboxylesterase
MNTAKRPLSQLIYKRVQDIPASPRIVTLHKHNQYGQDVKDFAFAASPDARIIGLESYKGVFVGKEIVGYTWFIGPFGTPSPLFFGDALAEIERFLWDEIDRQARPEAELPFLLGVEQGAIMAIASAAAVPDLVSGVIAVGGFLPIVPGWEPPLAPLEGLPVLLIEDPDKPAPANVLSGERLAETLGGWGAEVTLVTAPDPTEQVPAEVMSRWLSARSPKFRAVESDE